MVYLLFRSGDKTFEMGCMVAVMGEEHEDVRAFAIDQIRRWTPEERWERFMERDMTPVLFHHRGFRLSAAYIQLPGYVPEIFCVIEEEGKPPRSVAYIESVATQLMAQRRRDFFSR